MLLPAPTRFSPLAPVLPAPLVLVPPPQVLLPVPSLVQPPF